MKKYFQRFNRLSVTLLLLALSIAISAQDRQRKKMPAAPKDSSRISSIANIADTTDQHVSDSSISNSMARLGELDLQINKYRNRIKRGYSNGQSIETLLNYEYTINFLDSNLTSKNGIEELNLRNISSYKVILIQLEENLKSWKNDIEDYTFTINEGIYGINKDFKSIISHTLPEEDSILNLQYQESISSTGVKLLQLNHLRDSLFKILGVLQNRTTKSYVKVNELLDDVSQRVNLYSRQIFTQSHKPIWYSEKDSTAGGFISSVRYSIKPAFGIMIFYLTNTPLLILISILTAFGFYLWFNSNYRSLKSAKPHDFIDSLKFSKRKRGLDFLLFVFMLSPLLFNNPPALFLELMWLGAALITTAFLWPQYGPSTRIYWIGIMILYMYYGLDNILYTYSAGERWYLLAGNIMAVCMAIGIYVSRKNERKHWIVSTLLFIFLFANVLAFSLNIFGLVPLAKLLSVSSVIQIFTAAGLYVLSQVITEAIDIQFEIKKNSPTGAYLEFEKIRKTFTVFLNLGVVFYWFMAFIWSLSFSELIRLFVKQQLENTINIGSFSFTFGAIVAFFLSIWLSVMLANLLGVFFGSSGQQFANTNRSKTGSWIVVIRLIVITIGILIAFALAGIPMDKLTIVFGALSVGIGFGLQHIVNNLVSGIILVFEKPMQIGDVVEIGGQMGTVKQIGLRSSKIMTYEGADIIVPNGEFITQKLINWTHSNSFRRIEIFFEVAYGNDADKVIGLINEAVSKVDKVMTYPKPVTLFNEFGANGFNFRVLIWTSEIDAWLSVKSDTYEAIYRSLTANGFDIPYPKMDVYIKKDA